MAKRAVVAEDLHRAALRLLRRLRKADEMLAISTARLSALSVLVFVGPQSVGGLARIEQVSQPTMTSLTQGMIRQGLIRVKPDPNDRRVRQLVATAKGKKLLHRGRQKRIEMLSSMLQRFSADELRVLARAATMMESMLHDDGATSN